ncbi:MAG: hypothetical protein K6G45_08790 [Lachnospiraceae bacterium]|nr:hypothetical protein [Lachnospiraceae bacterium]
MKKITRPAFIMLMFAICLIIGITVPFGEVPASAGNGTQGYILTELGGNEYGYNSLSDSEKRLFDAIGEYIENFIASDIYGQDLDKDSASLEVIYELDGQDDLTKEDIAKVITRFVYSNPQYYWIGLEYSYALANGRAEAVLTVDPYYYSYSLRQSTDRAIETLAQDWVEQVRNAAMNGDYYGALKCHDLIIRAVDYAYDSAGKPESAMWAHSIAGVFTGQGAVCEGYAKSFEYILDRAGIPCIYIAGTGASEDHVWNAVEIGGKWYLCDITWDDPNSSTTEGLKDSNYTYFCIPESEFAKKHKPYGTDKYYVYELPEFEDTFEESFFTVFGCSSEEEFSEMNGRSFAETVLDSRYEDNDFVFILMPTDAEDSFISYVVPYLTGFDPAKGATTITTTYGKIVKYEAPVINNPADGITIDAEEISVAVAQSMTVKAILPGGSDDRVVWSVSPVDENDETDADRYLKLSARGTDVLITGRRNGTVKLTATVYSSLANDEPISASCIVTVGSGKSIAEAVIWQNGTKEKKTVTVNTKLSATTWTNSKGQSKQGKLVWYVSDKPTDPVFDKNKHTVSFLVPKSKHASINNKGVVTAKTAGTVFVYVCDTGKMTFEEHVIDIAAGPTKLFLTSRPNTTNKDLVYKKIGIYAGRSAKIYITPFIKDGAVDSECTYTVKVAKPEQAKYVSVVAPAEDEEGNSYFIVNALDIDRIKEKTVSVKVEVICDQTGKKSNLTVVVANPVYELSSEAVGLSEDSEPKLLRKNDTIKLKLKLTTMLGEEVPTTDKIKIYVGQSDVSFNDHDRVEADRGATVRAKFDRKTMTVTLTASKNAGVPALITAAFTDVLTKEIVLLDIADVDEKGNVTLW